MNRSVAALAVLVVLAVSQGFSAQRGAARTAKPPAGRIVVSFTTGTLPRAAETTASVTATSATAAWPGVATRPTKRQAEQERLAADRRKFQEQQLIAAQAFGYFFSPGETPRVVWRDADEVRRLGCTKPLRVRWFDADLNETTTLTRPGRWGAWIEGGAPNGTPLRRSMTFFCRPPGFFLFWPPDIKKPLSFSMGFGGPPQWQTHQDEIAKLSQERLLWGLNDNEAGAALVAGLCEIQAAGGGGETTDSASRRSDDYNLALKLKAQGLTDRVRPLAPPRRREQGAAPVLREGTPAEAGMRPDAKEKIDAVCRAWEADTTEPMVTLVARRGVVVTHEAFGKDKDGRPIGRDYRADVASITKFITSMLFSRFLDQGLIGLDDSVAKVFPDYPRNSRHVPTFRQLFTHTSGLTGHGEFGGAKNPNFENVVLSGIDALEPGKAYIYSGQGFELAVKAMELVSGKSMGRLYEDDLFRPLGIGGLPMDGVAAGARPTAWELGVLAQYLANRGSYGDLELASSATLDAMLPEPLGNRYPGIVEGEGIGQHWMNDLRSTETLEVAKPAGGTYFSARTLGHGSLSQCILRVDLEQQLVVIQIRKTGHPRNGEWSARFFQAIADAIVDDPAGR